MTVSHCSVPTLVLKHVTCHSPPTVISPSPHMSVQSVWMNHACVIFFEEQLLSAVKVDASVSLFLLWCRNYEKKKKKKKGGLQTENTHWDFTALCVYIMSGDYSFVYWSPFSSCPHFISWQLQGAAAARSRSHSDEANSGTKIEIQDSRAEGSALCIYILMDLILSKHSRAECI